jgi:hypothetical protein
MIVGVEGLSLAEVNLLRTILKLSTRLANDWILTEVGPCHVLLSTLAVTAERRSSGSHAHLVVPVVRRGQRPAGECLERPFRAEDFVELLMRVGPALQTEPGPAHTQEATEASTHRRGRLKRWPPSKFLGSSRERIQLATLLSRQARSAHELSSVAGCSEAECNGFMLELDRQDLLSWETGEAAGKKTAVSPHGTTANRGVHGLFSSIRRRLGLGLNNRSAE